MENRVKSTLAANNSNGSAQPTSFDKLSKSQLIELLKGNITKPLTPEGLYRCAVSVLGKWCDDVIKGDYASMYELTTKLDALKDIYNQR